MTVDALLLCQGKVLLIRRAQAPGRGLLVLPGGFIEPRETLWQSCLRELAEETHCTLPEATLRAALRDVAVFDHPERSQRGRVISHVHCFGLGDAALPEVRGGDDASAAQWVNVAALAALEDQFHDDHFHILDHFLGLNLGRASAQGIRQADVAPRLCHERCALCANSPELRRTTHNQPHGPGKGQGRALRLSNACLPPPHHCPRHRVDRIRDATLIRKRTICSV